MDSKEVLLFFNDRFLNGKKDFDVKWCGSDLGSSPDCSCLLPHNAWVRGHLWRLGTGVALAAALAETRTVGEKLCIHVSKIPEKSPKAQGTVTRFDTRRLLEDWKKKKTKLSDWA